jgi:hypothetical protein
MWFVVDMAGGQERENLSDSEQTNAEEATKNSRLLKVAFARI